MQSETFWILLEEENSQRLHSAWTCDGPGIANNSTIFNVYIIQSKGDIYKNTIKIKLLILIGPGVRTGANVHRKEVWGYSGIMGNRVRMVALRPSFTPHFQYTTFHVRIAIVRGNYGSSSKNSSQKLPMRLCARTRFASDRIQQVPQAYAGCGCTGQSPRIGSPYTVISRREARLQAGDVGA